MQLQTQGYTELLGNLNSLSLAVKSVQAPETSKREMTRALANTADVIKQTISVVKDYVSEILEQLKSGNTEKGRELLLQSPDTSQWDTVLRELQLSQKIQNEILKLKSLGVFQLTGIPATKSSTSSATGSAAGTSASVLAKPGSAASAASAGSAVSGNSLRLSTLGQEGKAASLVSEMFEKRPDPGDLSDPTKLNQILNDLDENFKILSDMFEKLDNLQGKIVSDIR